MSEESSVTPAAPVEAPAAAPAAAPVAQAAAPAASVAPTEAPAEVVTLAPEKYEFATPEGVTLDSEVVTAFEGVARELDLPQDKAQSVIDKVAPIVAKRQAAAFEAVKTGWMNEAKSDAEIGGEAFEANLATSKLAMDNFFAPEFKQYLESTGIGNHPEMIRGLYKIGKTLQEDPGFRGRQGGGAPKSQAERLFG